MSLKTKLVLWTTVVSVEPSSSEFWTSKVLRGDITDFKCKVGLEFSVISTELYLLSIS